MKRLAMLIAVVLISSAAGAHKPSDSYLTLQRDGNAVAGQWDIALRDLELAIGLDSNGDGDITWAEVRGQRDAITRYAMSRLKVLANDAPCTVRVDGLAIDTHTDGAYVVLPLAVDCATSARALAVDYALLFDVDPQHRGLLNFADAGETRSFIFSVDSPRQRVDGESAGRISQFVAYVREGVVHIWGGFDHLLFLLSLLLPAVLIRRADTWQPAASFRGVFWDVLKMVTAFTAAHALALSLAAFGWLHVPSRIVESCIALSIVFAALNNVRPVIPTRRWTIAFAFGLVHGLGFANVLADLGLPRETLLVALVAFNVGVELGQLALAAAFLPLAYLLRATAVYRFAVLIGGSLLIAVLGGAWFIERAFNMTLFGR